MPGGLIPASVTDPALRTLLEKLIDATGIGGRGPSPAKIGVSWRVSEGPFPTSAGSPRMLFQWLHGTNWETKATVDANGSVGEMGAWAKLTAGAAGAVTVTSGRNVTGASYATTDLTVNLAPGTVSDANYAIFPHYYQQGRTCGLKVGATPTAASFILQSNAGGGPVNWAAGDIVYVAILR